MAAGLQLSQAVVLNLTTAGSSGTINGAIFEQNSNDYTGTGVEPFVRLKDQEGFNTDRVPMPSVWRGEWTRDLLLSEVGVVTLDSIDYYQFLLDTYKRKAQGSITLHELQIFTKSGALPRGKTGAYGDLSANADLKWDLDAGEDSRITLNYALNPVSSYGDMFAYIPVSAVGTDTTKNLYLYSAFSTPGGLMAGYEEWAVLGNPPPASQVPDGGTTLATLGFALLGLGSARKLISKKA